MNASSRRFTWLLGMTGLALAATVVVSAFADATAGQGQAKPATAVKPKPAPATQATKQAPMRVSVPPLPNVGFAPVRPMDVVRATYDFAAQHPEILKYVPCYCGCGSQGHTGNESCFVARRDARGNVLEWDTHGFGCAVCIDVARESMQLYASGADVRSIRAAIERKWDAGNAAGKTPTPPPPPAPAKK